MHKYRIEKFQVIGIAVRTINANGQAAQDIEVLWEKFWNEKIQEQIPNKISDDIYAVYTDYESDFNGAYTCLIGLKVSNLKHIPENFVGISVEGADYQKFVSKGKMPEAVFNTWMDIWQSEDLNRAYQSDFTVHGEKYYDGNNAEVETFLSVHQ